MTGIALNILGWLTGSKAGRWAAVFMVGCLMIVWFLLVFKRAVISAEQSRQVAKSLNNLREKIKSDEEISRMSPDARRELLREWSNG